MAIIKEAIDPARVFNAGDDVTFRFTVRNQGNIDAINTVLTDYLPAGFMFDAASNPGWTGPNANGNLTFSVPLIEADPFDNPAINPYETIELNLTISETTMENCLVNEVEISSSGNPNFPDLSLIHI